jgi:hypothetical protein
LTGVATAVAAFSLGIFNGNNPGFSDCFRLGSSDGSSFWRRNGFPFAGIYCRKSGKREVAALVSDLLWVIGCYAAAAAMVQWAAKRRRPAPGVRVVLVAGNHQLQIEGCIRALWRWSRHSGKPLHIAVVLDRSEDETERIVERLGRHDDTLVWWRVGVVRPIGQATQAIRGSDHNHYQDEGENHAVQSKICDDHGHVGGNHHTAYDGHVAEPASGRGDGGSGGAGGSVDI